MLPIASPEPDTNDRGSFLHPGFVTEPNSEQRLHLSRHFSLAPPTSFQAGGFFVGAKRLELTGGLSTGSCALSSSFKETRHKQALTKEIIASKGKDNLFADVFGLFTGSLHIPHTSKG